MAVQALTYDTLLAACRPGGASVLTAVTELAPAAGLHAGVAPARYVRGDKPTYAFETRYVDLDGSGPVAASCVVLSSKGAALNAIEAALGQAIADGEEALAKTPRMRLTYHGEVPQYDYDVPHRMADGHFRAGTIGGEPATKNAAFRAARDSNQANAKALLETSPVSLTFGLWDATRRSHQARFRSALVGEIIGVLSDQGSTATNIPPRGAARTDQIAPSVRLSPDQSEQLVAAQEDELSAKNVKSIRDEISKAKKDARISASKLGLGSVPPSLDGLGLVSCRRIIRSHVLSFSTLRQLRFGLGAEGDAAARALLAALALAALVRSYDELIIRANCDLVEVDAPSFVLDGRYGRKTELTPLDADATATLLDEAIKAAVAAGVRWEGQVLDVVGNPLIAGGIEEEVEGD